MDFYEAIFLIAFLAALGILLLKLYSCIRLATIGPVYEFPGAVLSFVGYLIAWVVCLTVMLHDPTETIYATMLYLLNWCVPLNVLMFIIEIFLSLKGAAETPIEAFKSKPVSGRPYAPRVLK